MFHKVINVIAFQISWFAAVLGAAHGKPFLCVVVILFVLGLHLFFSHDWRPELFLALCAAVTGFVFDSVLIAAGVFSPVPYLFPAPLSSLWMVLLWVNLAMTLNVSMAWLHGRYALAAIFGAVGGPMAYYSGAKLGAMIRLPDPGGLLGIGIAWAFALPLLYSMANIFRERFHRVGKS
ncbi:MAG: DUF2878 domain-containing protein [Nitrospirota bacterium]|nr:DUF2878 domain-containing protein [Nitrospirota bacterium]